MALKQRQKKRPWDTEKGEVVTKSQITAFVLHELANCKEPLSEKQLNTKVYMRYNELLPMSVLITLKNRKLITRVLEGWKNNENF